MCDLCSGFVLPGRLSQAAAQLSMARPPPELLEKARRVIHPGCSRYQVGRLPSNLKPVQLEIPLGFWRESRRNPGLLRRNPRLLRPKAPKPWISVQKPWIGDPNSKGFPKVFALKSRAFAPKSAKTLDFSANTFESNEISSWTGFKFDRSRLT